MILDELDLPIVAAPMAGGPTTPELVIAAAAAGAIGFLAGGYLSAAALRERVDAVRAATPAFGVNLFAPNPVPIDPADYRRYRERIARDAERFGVETPPEPRLDDDAWRDKIDLLLERPVPMVSFTFGIPTAAEIAALRRTGAALIQTVTSSDEARRAGEAGVDALVIQAPAAGGHSATLRPAEPQPDVPLVRLLAEVRRVSTLPLIAAGGLSTGSAVRAAMASADAVMIGTALLLAPEAGTSEVHCGALEVNDRDTIVTRAFTGRPARALRNRFIDEHDGAAPTGYPALHHLTSPIRKAAARIGDAEYVHLWAGTGYGDISRRPAAQILRELAADL